MDLSESSFLTCHCTLGELKNGVKSTQLWQIISPWMSSVGPKVLKFCTKLPQLPNPNNHKNLANEDKKDLFLKEKEEKRKASLPSLYQTHSNIFLLMLFLSLKITWTLNLHFPDMSDTGAGVSLLLWHNRHCHNHPHRPHHHPPHHHHPVCLILMPGCRLASLAGKIAVTLFSPASIYCSLNRRDVGRSNSCIARSCSYTEYNAVKGRPKGPLNAKGPPIPFEDRLIMS